jgi:hypothetical protein
LDAPFHSFLRPPPRHDTQRFSDPFTYVADFGFFANGTLNVSWNNAPGAQPYDVDLLIFTDVQYGVWYREVSEVRGWHNCSDKPAAIGHMAAILSDTSANGGFTVPSDRVHVVIVQPCRSDLSGKFYIDARFLNPNGQHLDSRDVPSLKAVPALIPLFAVLLCVWIGVIAANRIGFHKIYLCIGVIVFLYVIYLCFYEASVYYAQTTDATTVWMYLRMVFECIHEISLFSTLVIASSGWCLLNVEIKWHSVVLSIVSAAFFGGDGHCQGVRQS